MPSYSDQAKLNGERYEPLDLTKRLLGLTAEYPSEDYPMANGIRILGQGSQSTGYDRRIKVDRFALRELRAQDYSRWVCHQLCYHYPEREEQRRPLYARAA